ncbi:MAG TPA: hypothetical protein VH186_03870 [Chloroflexia bacterium]|nr:hypothetical protein [Chloroflexia bacterium]
MLIEWGNIFLWAGIASLVTLLMLQLYRWQKKELSLLHSVGLALVCGLGFVTWFTIFNIFSLSALDRDLPIPLFPISPEDMGCGITVLLFTFSYGVLLSTFRKNKLNQNSWRQFGILAWLIPALVALLLDVYFI